MTLAAISLLGGAAVAAFPPRRAGEDECVEEKRRQRERQWCLFVCLPLWSQASPSSSAEPGEQTALCQH